MKNLQQIVLLSLMFVSIFACKDKDEPQAQDPDDNEFVQIMRNMNENISAVNMTGHADVDYAAAMVVHHQAAIDMAEKELANGDDETVRSIAQKVKDRHTTERDFLNAWLVDRNPTRNAEGESFDAEMQAALSTMKQKQEAQTVTGDADRDFAELLKIHHEASIQSSNSIVHWGHHEEIMAAARVIILDQTHEVEQLDAWLRGDVQ